MSRKSIFTIKEAKEVMKFSILNSGVIKIPVILWGYHGIGKTEIVTQVCKELDYNLIVLHLSTQDIIDLIGRPITTEVEIGGEKIQVQEWCVPSWLKDARLEAEKNGRPTVFFLDEMNRGPRLVQSAMLPFLIEGKIHTHQINEKDAIIAACNPADENYDVNDLIDQAQLDRLGHMILKPTPNEYINYLKRINMDPVTIKVLEKESRFIKIPDIDIGFEVKPGRRKIKNIMSIVGKKDSRWIDKNGERVIKAYLGDDFWDVYNAERLKLNETITMDMIRDYDKNEKEITKLLTTKIGGIKETNMGVLENTSELILSELEDSQGLDVDSVKWFVKFYSNPRVPDEEVAKVFSHDVVASSILDGEVNEGLRDFVASNKVFNPEGIELW